jgi:L-cystine uptake protein TcyP (sodium:dicarboxylate symporter family)
MFHEGCERNMMPFLYFPEDKSEYIPAVIALVIFVILAGVAMYLIYKKSKKDEEKFNEKYNQRISEAEDRH